MAGKSKWPARAYYPIVIAIVGLWLFGYSLFKWASMPDFVSADAYSLTRYNGDHASYVQRGFIGLLLTAAGVGLYLYLRPRSLAEEPRRD